MVLLPRVRHTTFAPDENLYTYNSFFDRLSLRGCLKRSCNANVLLAALISYTPDKICPNIFEVANILFHSKIKIL